MIEDTTIGGATKKQYLKKHKAEVLKEKEIKLKLSAEKALKDAKHRVQMIYAK